MLQILSFLGFGLFFLAGLLKPRKAGWFAILLIVILGQAPFAIIPSDFMPLTPARIAVAITLGILLKKYGDIHWRYLLKSSFIKFLVVYTGLLLVISLGGEYMRHLIVGRLPRLFYSLLLSFLLIKDINDLKRLIKMLVWGGAVINFFIIIEYFTDFNIALELAQVNPDFDDQGILGKGTKIVIRSGFYRAVGITGSPVQTAYYLAFLFPLTLWYSIRTKFKLQNYIPLAFMIVGITMLQSRASFVAIIAGILVLMYMSVRIREVNVFQNIGRPVFVLLFFTLTIIIAFPFINNILSNFFYQSITAYDDPTSGVYIYSKIERVPRAIDYFLNRPLVGYGAPQHVYFELMETDDLPAPLVMLLAGGIPFALAYLLMLFSMPYSIFKWTRRINYDDYQKRFLIFASSAFLTGIIAIFSNYVENHFWVMFMFYVSIFKVFYLKPLLIKKGSVLV